MKEATTDIDKREEETWERESGSSKDSRGQGLTKYMQIQIIFFCYFSPSGLSNSTG